MQQKAFRVIAAKIQKYNSRYNWLNEPSVSEVKNVALLAWEGHLTSLEGMRIMNMDITDIPLAQMKKLTAIFTGNGVLISNITPSSHLSSILAGVKCKKLVLCEMALSEENIRALVTAMRERVKDVLLDNITSEH